MELGDRSESLGGCINHQGCYCYSLKGGKSMEHERVEELVDSNDRLLDEDGEDGNDKEEYMEDGGGDERNSALTVEENKPRGPAHDGTDGGRGRDARKREKASDRSGGQGGSNGGQGHHCGGHWRGGRGQGNQSRGRGGSNGGGEGNNGWQAGAGMVEGEGGGGEGVTVLYQIVSELYCLELKYIVNDVCVLMFLQHTHNHGTIGNVY